MRKSDLTRSYEAYKRMRLEWKSKGYGVMREMTRAEFKMAYEGLKEAEPKNSHISRTIAGMERNVTTERARAIKKNIDIEVKNARQIIKDLTLKEKDKGKLTVYEQRRLTRSKKLLEKSEKYKTVKDIYGISYTEEEEAELMEAFRKKWEKKGKTPRIPYQPNARAKLFKDLLDAGFSFKNADRVVYGNIKAPTTGNDKGRQDAITQEVQQA